MRSALERCHSISVSQAWEKSHSPGDRVAVGRLRYHRAGAWIRRIKGLPCPVAADERYRRRRRPRRGATGPPGTFRQPSPRYYRAAQRQRRAFPIAARSHRHVHAPRHVLAAGLGCCSPARACADFRTHQGRNRGRKGKGVDPVTNLAAPLPQSWREPSLDFLSYAKALNFDNYPSFPPDVGRFHLACDRGEARHSRPAGTDT